MLEALAIVSPLPPTRNGIADYSYELIPYLSKYFNVFAVIADDAPDPTGLSPTVEVVRASAALKDSRLDAAQFLYHFGNNPDHSYALQLLLERPGVVVLHDFVLSYLLETSTFRYGDRQTFGAWAQHDHGEFGRQLAESFLSRGWRGRFMAQTLALNGPVLSRATAVITHSRYSQVRAAARIPLTPVHCIPHHVAPEVIEARSVDRIAARKILGLPEQAILVHAFGFVTQSKLIDRTLASLARLAAWLPDFRFVIAGERRPYEYDVDAFIRSSGLGDRVITTDYIDEEQFQLHLSATDLVMNLRWPIGGESSGSLTRALGRGRACVVVDSGPMGEFPSSALVKLPMSDAFDTALDETLRRLISSRAARGQLEANALELAADWTAESSARRYADVIAAAPRLATRRPPVSYGLGGRAAAFAARALPEDKRFLLEAEGLWWRVGAVPVWSGQPDERILCEGTTSTDAQLLEALFGWPEAALALTEAEQAQDGFATALLRFGADATDLEIMEALARVAPRLRRGATLIIEGPGSSKVAGRSRSRRSPQDWLRLIGCGSTMIFGDGETLPELETDSPIKSEGLAVAAGRLSSHAVIAPRGYDDLTSRIVSGLRPAQAWALAPHR